MGGGRQFVARVDIRDVSSVLFAGRENHVQSLGIAGMMRTPPGEATQAEVIDSEREEDGKTIA